MTDSPNVIAGRKLGAEMADRARAEWEAQRKQADERLRTQKESEHQARLDAAMRRSQQEIAASYARNWVTGRFRRRFVLACRSPQGRCGR
jgi:hypothetical protein